MRTYECTTLWSIQLGSMKLTRLYYLHASYVIIDFMTRHHIINGLFNHQVYVWLVSYLSISCPTSQPLFGKSLV